MPKLLLLVVLAMIFTAGAVFAAGDSPCTWDGPVASAVGYGKVPADDGNAARARLLAVRAAIVEARRNLLACMADKKLPLEGDLEGKVKGAVVTQVRYPRPGVVVVTVSLDTREAS